MGKSVGLHFMKWASLWWTVEREREWFDPLGESQKLGELGKQGAREGIILQGIISKNTRLFRQLTQFSF